MSDFELRAEAREELGKGATRRLRREGLVPAVMYGGTEQPVSLTLRANELRKQLENEAFYSHILTLTHGGRTHQVVLKGLQRHPATDDVIHVDLQRASADQVLHMLVPLHFLNEETSAGRRAGGVITHLVNEVDVTCKARDLPEFIEVDMGALELGELVHLSDLKVPDGVELSALAHGDDQAVASIQAPGGGISDDEETEEDEEGDDEV
ncbi:MAG: 50S ribosomal protein L25/general stress protein Ctc [Pseudomonadota bacterium]